MNGVAPAVVLPQVVSKVVTCPETEITIPPKESFKIKIEYVPRKVNSNYRKTLTVQNCLNPADSKSVEVQGSNVDTHHVLWHSAFYKLTIGNRLKQQQVGIPVSR